MVTKINSAKAGHARVIFELPACLWADQIFVVGEFNDWDERSLQMHQDRDGIWRLELDLPTGKSYQFRYQVDGRWLTDNHADAVISNPYGTQNSLVTVTPVGDEWTITVAPPLR